jgi:hypothetical protein
MIQVWVIAAFALVVMGVILGAVAVVCIGIRREEKAMSLARPAPGRLANGVRAVNGFYSRGLSQARTCRGPQDLPPADVLSRPAGRR